MKDKVHHTYLQYMISMQYFHFAQVSFEQEKMGRLFNFNRKYIIFILFYIIFHVIFLIVP